MKSLGEEDRGGTFMNQSIELHDSTVVAIRESGGEVQLDLEAYVHRTEGRPGIDPGTGWRMPVRMTIASATVVRAFRGDSLWIIDGAITVGSTVFENMIPVAFDSVDEIEMRFSGGEGSLTVTGKGLRVEPTGEAEYVEEFSGSATLR
jgi:hypothetical protein